MSTTTQPFSCYRNVYQVNEEKRMTLEEVYKRIRSDELKFVTAEIRRLTAEQRHEEAHRLKMGLPAFAVPALFPHQRLTEQAGEYTGHILVDIDELSTSPAQCKERCILIPSLALVHDSARGNGLHLIFRVDTTAAQHEAACQALFDMVEGILGERPDRVCTDLTRMSLLCHDPACYFNPDAPVFQVPKAYLTPPAPAPTVREWSERRQEVGSSERLSLYIDQAIRPGDWQQGVRHGLLVRLAYSLNRAGFPEHEVVAECLRRFTEASFGEKEICKIISSVYIRKRSEHGINGRKQTAFRSPESTESVKSVKKSNSILYSGEEAPEKGQEATDEHVNHMLQGFPRDVTEHLPALLRDAIRPGMTDTDRDLALLSAITLLSTVTPRISGSYQRKKVYPPLYTCILAPAGSGKGLVSSIQDMADGWHCYIRTRSEREVKEYEKKLEAYQLAKDNYKRKGTGTIPDMPYPVLQKELSIAGDITKPKLIEQLKANDHYAALMQESEIGVLVSAINQDYGKYNYLLNQAAHHERVSNDTRTNGSKKINAPRIGLLLSGTFGQFSRFIPTLEDGLFSRFIGYLIMKPGEWKDLTDDDDTPQSANFYLALSQRVLDMGLHLDQHATWISYTKSQRDKINIRFKRLLTTIQAFGTEPLDSLVYRAGLAHFRICMTLTAIRKAEDKCTDDTLCILDEDMETGYSIVKTCLSHMMVASTLLKKDTSYNPPTNPTLYEQLFHDLPEQFRTSDALETGKAQDVSESTVKRLIKIWVEKGITIKVSAGKFKKKEVEPADTP